jgi:hypothetical protein
MEFKVCRTCRRKLELSSSNFTKDKAQSDGLSPYCKECTRRRTVLEYRRRERLCRQKINDELEPVPVVKRLDGETDDEYCRRHNRLYPLVLSDEYKARFLERKGGLK